MARKFKPDAMLDIRLPVIDGWTVLDRLKHDPPRPYPRPYPFQSSQDGSAVCNWARSLICKKPVTNEALKEALADIKVFIERQVNFCWLWKTTRLSESIIELIRNSDVCTTAVGTGAAALAALKWAL